MFAPAVAHPGVLHKDDTQGRQCREIFLWSLCNISFDGKYLELRVVLCQSQVTEVAMCFVMHYFSCECLCSVEP